MGFKEELQDIVGLSNSPKLDNVKLILKKVAASGKSTTTLESNIYDEWVLKWLYAEGFEIEEYSDQREGNFIRVSWNPETN